MKMLDSFKQIKEPEEFVKEEFEAYLKELYNQEDYEKSNYTYKQQPIGSKDPAYIHVVEEYQKRVSILVDKLEKIHPKFKELKDQFKDVSPGETRYILDLIRETMEMILYKNDKGLIKNPVKLKAQIENSTINACASGALTNMQNILFSISDSLYFQKYNYISDFAVEYINRTKFESTPGNELHTVNQLIHEVSRDYNVAPPKDIFANYRNLDLPAEDFYIAGMKKDLNEHFASRKGVHGFVSYLASEYAGRLPNMTDSKNFPYKDENNNNSTQFEAISNIANELGMPVDQIITCDINDDGLEDYNRLKYKDDYFEAIELWVMIKLKNENFIDYENLKFKSLYQVSDNDKIENTFDIIEAPNGWYKFNSTDSSIEKILDTKSLKELTVNEKNIEDFLHDYLKTKPNISFNQDISNLIPINDVSLNTDDTHKQLFLLSDQGKKILEYFDSKEEVLKLSDSEIEKWKQLINENDELLYIVSNGDEKMLERFIKREKLSVEDWKDKDNQTLLHIAVKNNVPSIIPKLLDLGMNFNVKNIYGNTPLHYAVLEKNIEIINTLMNKGCDINIKNIYGNTPLHFAVRENNIDIINLLVKKGGDINIQNKDDETPLHSAVREKKIDAIKAFLKYNPDLKIKNKDGQTALDIAKSLNDKEIIKAFPKAGIVGGFTKMVLRKNSIESLIRS